MGNDKRAQDTLFIDMKYIILYRKLGFKEVSPDIFIKSYPSDISITIESENQRFSFQNNWYPLKEYKDMVLLECVDRLLKIGYMPENLRLNQEFDIAVLTPEKEIFCGVFVEQWGKDFQKLAEKYRHINKNTVALYTSQLSGGLIDFESKIFAPNGVFETGIFEKQNIPYNAIFSSKETTVNFDENKFVIVKNELIKYIGNEETVVIPNGVSRIGTGAFWNNLIIKEIKIPNTVTCIAGDAFVYCENLEKIAIPVSVNEMGDNPFAGCPKLNITCLSNDFLLEDGILFDKDKRMLIHYTPSKPDNRYTILESVEWVGKHSFYKCLNLCEVVVTKNVAFMGNNVFSDCLNIRLINESPFFEYIDGVLYNKELTQVYHYSMGSHIKRVNIAEGVRTIGRNAFWNAKEIEKIVIPSTVRQIGYNPFAYCINAEFENLSPFYTLIHGVLYSHDLKELVCCTSKTAQKEIILPKELISIGRNAFTGCESLRKITLPEGLEAIARGAFSGCINLEEISVPNTVKFVGDWCFNNCSKLKTIRIPVSVKIEKNLTVNSPAEIVRY